MIRLLSAFLLLVFTLSFPSFPQLKNGKTLWQKNGIKINDSLGRSIRQNARIVCLDDNTSLMVWEDSRNGYFDIYAQKIGSNGEKLWGKGGIAVCPATKNQTFPQIIDAGKNEVIIVWQDHRNGYSDIYAQKLNSKGNLLWEKDGLPVCRAAANQLAPQLASDGAGGAIITWYDYRLGKGEDIYAQKISGIGTNEWTLDGVPVCVEPATQWYPQIVSDASGGAVITWEDKRSGFYDIYAQKLDRNGNPAWQINGISICNAPDNQQYCQIASCDAGSFVVAWQDYRNGNADIYAQKIDQTGRILWKTNGEIVCNVANNQEKPQLVGGSNSIIVWTDFRNGTGNSDIFCQKISSDGKPLWNQFGVAVCETNGNQSDPKAVSDADGGAFVAWTDRRNSSTGIFSRRMNKDGKALWVPDGKTIANTNINAEFPQIALLNNGNAVIVWQDRRHGGLDVYVQGVSQAGTALWANNGMEVAFAFGSVSQQKPRVIRCGKDGYIIVFEDYRNGYSNIHAQKINNKGALLWDRESVQVCNFESNQLNPEVAYDDEGGAIVVWEDMRGTTSNIYAQRMDSYGNRLWDENGILICQSVGEKLNPKVVRDSAGGAIIAWQDASKNNIYIQRIDKNGSLSWRIDGVPINKSEAIQSNLQMASDDEGGAVLTWIEYKGALKTPDVFAQRVNGAGNILWGTGGLALCVCRAPEAQRNPWPGVGEAVIIVWEDSGGGNYDIYAQKINKDGSTSWTSDGIPISVAPFTQHEPKLLMNDDGGATITWEDYRNANWDIYAQRVSPSGNVMWKVDGIPLCTVPGTQYAPQIVKSRGMSSLVVWEDYRNNLSYNIFAQKISETGEILWDRDGTPICMTEGGARSPQVVEDGEGGAIVVWTDYRYGNYDIYAQRINENQAK
jgi:hypothetical protein